MITELRTTLVADLEAAGLDVYNVFPNRFNPPGVLVMPSDSGSYLSVAQPRIQGHFEVALDVLIVVSGGDMSEVIAKIEGLAETVLIYSRDWAFRGMDAPDEFLIHGELFPGALLHIAKQDKLF